MVEVGTYILDGTMVEAGQLAAKWRFHADR